MAPANTKLVIEVRGDFDSLEMYESEIKQLFSSLGHPEHFSMRMETGKAMMGTGGKLLKKGGLNKAVGGKKLLKKGGKPQAELPGQVKKMGLKQKKMKGKGKGKGGKGKAPEAGAAPQQQQGGKNFNRKQRRQQQNNNGEQRFTGQIAKFNGKKGYYYVKCDALAEHFSCDVIAQKEELPAGAKEGSTINFVAMEAETMRNPIAMKIRMA